MGDYTFIRVEANVGPAARVLRKVPGVAVGDESGERAEGDDFAASRVGPGETPPPSEAAVDLSGDVGGDDEGGLKSRLPPVVREYGLLLVGVLFLLVGVASAALWWLRRRNADESETEPPTVDSFDEPVDEWRPDNDDDGADREAGDVETGNEGDATADPRAVGVTDAPESTVLDEDPGPREPSADRLGSGPAVESPTEAGEEDQGDDEGEPSEPATGPAGSVDVAPLLGMGFLAVAAAVVKWAQREPAGER